MTLIGLGVMLFALSLRRRDLAPRVSTVMWGSGMALGAITWQVLRWREVGDPDRWGDYPLVTAIALPAGVVVMAIGLAGIGRWLGGEQPADLTPREPLSTA